MLMVDRDGCKLYELFAARQSASGTWHAGSGAIWDLTSNALRPTAGRRPTPPACRSCPASSAGTRWRRARSPTPCGSRRPETRDTYIYPARHEASSSHSASLPPMGLRVRLKANADLTGLSHDAKVIAVALQRYGMILADNGSPWYVSGRQRPALRRRRAARAGPVHGRQPRGGRHQRSRQRPGRPVVPRTRRRVRAQPSRAAPRRRCVQTDADRRIRCRRGEQRLP